MRNFYSVKNKYIFDTDMYLEEWEKYLDFSYDERVEKKSSLQSLAAYVRNLWQVFNEERKDLDKYYMDSAVGQKAYFAAFLLPNIERVFSLLSQNENAVIIEKILAEDQDELVLADFGAGPLSASVGFLAVLESILGYKPHIKVPKKIRIYAVDRSEKIVNMGKQLLEPALSDKNKVEIIWVTSAEKIPESVHIIFCANILNEIPEKHRLKTLKLVYSKLFANGALLILEPGQQVHAKNLGALRDDFFKCTDDCEIISPCAHQKSCPLSAKVLRKDWCWFRHSWNPPKSLALIDKLAKIDHHELNYSFLFLQKAPTVKASQFYARCVSDELHMKEDVQQKFLLCTADGVLEPIYFTAEESVEKNYYRGKRIEQTNPIV